LRLRKGNENSLEKWKAAIDVLVNLDNHLRTRWIGFTSCSVIDEGVFAGGLVLVIFHFTPAVPFCLACDLVAIIIAIVAVGVGSASLKLMSSAVESRNRRKELELFRASSDSGIRNEAFWNQDLNDMSIEECIQDQQKSFFEDVNFPKERDTRVHYILQCKLSIDNALLAGQNV